MLVTKLNLSKQTLNLTSVAIQTVALDTRVIFIFVRSTTIIINQMTCAYREIAVCKYAKFEVFYTKIVQMTPLRLRRESL